MSIREGGEDRVDFVDEVDKGNNEVNIVVVTGEVNSEFAINKLFDINVTFISDFSGHRDEDAVIIAFNKVSFEFINLCIRDVSISIIFRFDTYIREVGTRDENIGTMRRARDFRNSEVFSSRELFL